MNPARSPASLYQVTGSSANAVRRVVVAVSGVHGSGTSAVGAYRNSIASTVGPSPRHSHVRRTASSAPTTGSTRKSASGSGLPSTLKMVDVAEDGLPTV